jgi:hypothetical protein
MGVFLRNRIQRKFKVWIHFGFHVLIGSIAMNFPASASSSVKPIVANRAEETPMQFAGCGRSAGLATFVAVAVAGTIIIRAFFFIFLLSCIGLPLFLD